MRSELDQRPRNHSAANRSSQSYRETSQRSQSFGGHGLGDRIRGNGSEKYERYLALAREAARADDRVASENYYQHAEHYLRIKNLAREGHAAAQQPRTAPANLVGS
jgi:hypothetical protein